MSSIKSTLTFKTAVLALYVASLFIQHAHTTAVNTRNVTNTTAFVKIYLSTFETTSPPLYSSLSPSGTTFNSNNNGAVLPPTLPGVYNALYWAFDNGPFNYQSGFCASVCPESFPGQAVFTADTDGNASIRVNYKGSRIEAFTLMDFYWGCESVEIQGRSSSKSKANTTASAAVGSDTDTYERQAGRPTKVRTPTPCTLKVRGYSKRPLSASIDDDNNTLSEHGVDTDIEAGVGVGFGVEGDTEVAVATFAYIPQIRLNPHTGAPSAQMTHAILPSDFNELKSVVFTAFSHDRSAYTRGPQVLVDNVRYQVKLVSEDEEGTSDWAGG